MKNFFLFVLYFIGLSNYAQDGSLDFSFSNVGFSGGSLQEFGVQSDGKVIVIGTFTSINNNLANGIARLNTDGSLDTSFNVDGSGFIYGSGLGPNEVLIQSDDKIIVIGQFSGYNGIPKSGIVRLEIDGAIDPTFLGNGFSGGAQLREAALKSNGQIIVHGAFSSYNNSSVTSNLIVINSNGLADPGFNASGSVGVNVDCIEPQPDGKILIYTQFSSFLSSITPQHDHYLRRLNSNGSLDSSFLWNNTILYTENVGGNFPQNSGSPCRIFDIKYLSTGKIMISGNFINNFGNGAQDIARLNANGGLDTSFTTTGVAISSTNPQGVIYTMAIQPDGKILIGGSFNLYAGTNPAPSIARINTTGTFDNTFYPGTGVTGSSKTLFSLKQTSNEKIYGCGRFTAYNNEGRIQLFRLNSKIIANPDNATIQAGTTSTPITNVRVNDKHYGTAATPSNTLLTFISSTHPGITLTSSGAVNVDANVPEGTYTLIYRICSTVYANRCTEGVVTITVLPIPVIAVDDTINVYIGGITTNVSVIDNDYNGSSNATISNVTPSFISATNSGITLLSDGKINVTSAVPLGTYTLNYKICATGSSTNCDTGIATVNVLPAPVLAANNDLISACLNGIDGGSGGNIFTNDTADGQPLDYNIITVTLVSNGGISGLSLSQSGEITIPPFTPFGTYTLSYKICQPNTSNCSTANATFCVGNGLNPGGQGSNNVIYDVKIQSDGKILIGGTFTKYNGITRNRIARLNSDLTLDSTFDPSGIGFNGTVNSIAIQGNKILVGGSYTGRTDGIAIQHLARLNDNGSLDNTFTSHTFNSNNATNVRIIKLSTDGNMMIGGSFDNVDGLTGTACVIKLNSAGSNVSSFISPYKSPTGGSVFDIYIYPNNSALIASSAAVLNQNNFTRFLVKVDSAGTLDPNFTTGTFSTISGWLSSIVVKDDGKIITGGVFNNYLGTGRNNLIQLNSNGTYDSGALINNTVGFGSSGFSNGPVNSLLLDQNNKLIISGSFTTFNGISRNMLVRINADGSLDTSFATGTGFNGPVNKSAVQNDGKIIAGGNFTSYNGNVANFITRLIPSANPAIQGRIIMQNTEESKNVFVYPNPSTGIINIDLQGYQNSQFDFSIFSITGQLIYKGLITEVNNQIDISYCEDGSYFMILQNERETIYKKLLIKK